MDVFCMSIFSTPYDQLHGVSCLLSRYQHCTFHSADYDEDEEGGEGEDDDEEEEDDVYRYYGLGGTSRTATLEDEDDDSAFYPQVCISFVILFTPLGSLAN